MFTVMVNLVLYIYNYIVHKLIDKLSLPYGL